MGGHILDTILMPFKRGLNWTLLDSEQVMGIDRDDVNIRLDPSLDALRANLCDTVLNSIKTPIFDPLITQGQIIVDVQLLIMSHYFSQDTKEKFSTGIRGSFSSFKPEAFIIILNLILIHFLLMTCSQKLLMKWIKMLFSHNKMRRRYKNVIDKKSIYNFIFCNFTHQSVSFITQP